MKINNFLVKDGKKCTCKGAERVFDGEYKGKLFFSCSHYHRVSIVDDNNPLVIMKLLMTVKK